MIPFLLVMVPCVLIGTVVAVFALRMGWAPAERNTLPSRREEWTGFQAAGIVVVGVMVMWILAWIVLFFIGLHLILGAG